MKYTVSNPETEERLALVELSVGSAGPVCEITTYNESKQPEKKSSLALSSSGVSLEGGVLDLRGSEGTRHVFPVTSKAPDGSVMISTALGNVRLTVTRGEPAGGAGAGRSAHKAIKSSMPGKVLKILCGPGDRIEAGQPLLIIEAMKMENEIRAPQSGLVEEIPVQPGQKVETGEVLVKLGTGESFSG